MADSDLHIFTFVAKMRNVLETSGLKTSHALFSPTMMPKTVADGCFCLDIQTKDTGKYRNGGAEQARVVNTVLVKLAKKIKPLDQFTSQMEYLASEETVMKVMMKRSNFPDALVNWTSTKRTLTNSKEYMVIEMSFDCEHDWQWKVD